MLLMIGAQEIIIILIIVLVLFGGKKIPELMRGLGKGVKEFQKAKSEFDEELNGTAPNSCTTPNKPEQATEPTDDTSSHAEQPTPPQA